MQDTERTLTDAEADEARDAIVALLTRITSYNVCYTKLLRSGALHGLMRIRGFTQDDGHIFCTEDQILSECVAYTALLQKVYADRNNFV